MSDQLTAAAQAMDVPEPLVERSARARAEATGSSYEDILTAWAGGEAVATAPDSEAPAETEEPEPASEAPPEDTAPAEPAPAEPAPVPEPAAMPAPVAAAVEAEPDEEVEPLGVGERVGLAGRIGAWTGGILGLLGFVFASTWLLGVASVAGEEGAYGPAVEVVTSRFFVGAALLSVLFGVVVASTSRALAAWIHPGARLKGRYTATVVLGAILGLVLGLAAGAVMTSAFAEPVEGVEGSAVMRVIPSIFVVLLGGAFLGWITATLVQVIGVPVGVGEEDEEEITDVRGRLTSAFSIPVAAILLLLLLVVPLGLVFIRSNEMASGGAAVLAIFAAAAILGISTISASRPTMRITFGEFLVAAAGIATVVVIVFAVLQTQAGPEEEAAEGEEAEQVTEDEGTTDEQGATGDEETTEDEGTAEDQGTAEDEGTTDEPAEGEAGLRLRVVL